MDRAANDHATDHEIGHEIRPEQVRSHLARPRVERPMSSVEHASATSATQISTPPRISVPARISVMEWLLAVGHAVASRLKGAPPSAMAQLHPPD
jgi:hypothetical protein